MRLLRGVRLIDPTAGCDAVTDVYVADGRIAAVGAAPAGFEASAAAITEAAGCVLSPGFVELHCGLFEHERCTPERLAEEAGHALRCGFTAVALQPGRQQPLDSQWAVRSIAELDLGPRTARYLPLGALTHDLGDRQLAPMRTLLDAGAAALSLGGAPAPQSLRLLLHAMQYAETCGATVLLRCLHPDWAGAGAVHPGPVSSRLGLPESPPEAETVEVARVLQLAERTGVRIHIGRISCARSLRLIAEARERGARVTCDAAVYHLVHTGAEIPGYQAGYDLDPPLRTAEDAAALRQGLIDGTLDALCTDHRPAARGAALPFFSDFGAGVAGLDALLPYFSRLRRDIPLPALVRAITTAPRAILGLEPVEVTAGSPVDLCLWSLDEPAAVSAWNNPPPLLRHPQNGSQLLTLLGSSHAEGAVRRQDFAEDCIN
ncbi:MAG: hypothetical protein ISN29_04765 [Gammaproteobacteria bacterium AqS3]|nr:hypothetical protein [Gammaproteobacteria bacterium AqS3]